MTSVYPNRWFALLVAFALFQTPAPLHAGIFQNCLIALGNLHRELTQDQYRTNRGFLGYRLYLGKNFLSGLAKLDKDAHWIDVGAGDANAARQYHDSWLWSWFLTRERARVTAVGIEEPRSPRTKKFMEASAEEKFRYLHGTPVEKQDLDKLGRADLITDVYGALSYAKEFDEVLTTYGKFLKPGGELLTALETGHTEQKGHGEMSVFTDFKTFTMRDASGQPMELEAYLKLITGFTVETEQIKLPTGVYLTRLRLTRNGDAVFVPKLKLIKMKNGFPPSREYQLEK